MTISPQEGPVADEKDSSPISLVADPGMRLVLAPRHRTSVSGRDAVHWTLGLAGGTSEVTSQCVMFGVQRELGVYITGTDDIGCNDPVRRLLSVRHPTYFEAGEQLRCVQVARRRANLCKAWTLNTKH